MGDIRSSWEIALEKADRLGGLSSEERTRQKEEQYRSAVVMLVHQYLDNKDIRPVKKELDKYTDKDRELLERLLLDELINAIDLDKQESLALIFSGIKAFSDKEEAGHGIDAIKQLYNECHNSREEEKHRADDAGRQLLRDMGISGSAIGTINIYDGEEWHDRLNTVDTYFKKQLESLKKEIIN
jgi:hypothetical protein